MILCGGLSGMTRRARLFPLDIIMRIVMYTFASLYHVSRDFFFFKFFIIRLFSLLFRESFKARSDRIIYILSAIPERIFLFTSALRPFFIPIYIHTHIFYSLLCSMRAMIFCEQRNSQCSGFRRDNKCKISRVESAEKV